MTHSTKQRTLFMDYNPATSDCNTSRDYSAIGVYSKYNATTFQPDPYKDVYYHRGMECLSKPTFTYTRFAIAVNIDGFENKIIEGYIADELDIVVKMPIKKKFLTQAVVKSVKKFIPQPVIEFD